MKSSEKVYHCQVGNIRSAWIDPSGFSAEPGLGGDFAISAYAYAMQHGGYAGILGCLVIDPCREAYLGHQSLIDLLGSQGEHFIEWTAESLQQVLLYPQDPTPVSPGALALSISLSNTPVWGDLYDLVSGVTGYDVITGQRLAGSGAHWARIVSIIGVIPLPGISGGNLRHGVHAIDAFASHGDDLARFIGKAARNANCSFDAETPVTTDEGAISISALVDASIQSVSISSDFAKLGCSTKTTVD